MANPLDPRAAELLKLLVERYIHDGQPVGSRTLSRAGSLSLSPATIRNVMADLDELGLVVSPHTSAGRVPTSRSCDDRSTASGISKHWFAATSPRCFREGFTR